MRILLTGAAGFLGTRVASRLLAAGHQSIAVVRAAENSACAKNVSPHIEAVGMDLAEFDARLLPPGIDAVVSLAQAREYRDFPERANEVFAVNVAANVALFDWARRSGVSKFVLVSSGGIYGERDKLDLDETERFPVPSAISFYLTCKLCAEMLFQPYSSFFTTATILRPFFIYGPGQRPEMLVPRLIASIRAGQPISIQGEDGARLTPTFVEDAAGAVVAALDLEGQFVFNVAGPQDLTIRQMAETIAHAVGRQPAFAHISGAPLDLVAKADLARARLGVLSTTFSAGIARTVEH